MSEARDEPAAQAFFNKAIIQHGVPEKVAIDKSGANAAALDTINIRLWLSVQVTLLTSKPFFADFVLSRYLLF